VLPAEPPTLETIRSPIAEPFERFQTELDDAFLCDVGLVGTVGAHLHRAYGKDSGRSPTKRSSALWSWS